MSFVGDDRSVGAAKREDVPEHGHRECVRALGQPVGHDGSIEVHGAFEGSVRKTDGDAP